MRKDSPREALRQAKRLVIKLGSTVVTRPSGEVDEENLAALAGQIVPLVREGREVVIVTSGAIRSGRARLGLSAREDSLPARQAAAAVGQIELMWRYREIFGRLDQPVAQILLTQAEFADFRRYLHLRNTLFHLLRDCRAIPVLNENDSVSVEGVQIGENDRLASVVAAKLDADALLALSDVPGFFSANPALDPAARLIEVITDITPEIEAAAQDSAGPVGRGGMRAKLEAARLAMTSGVTMVIASGREPDVIRRLLSGEPLGTLVVPRPAKLRSRKRWIGFAVRARGKLVVDDGACGALVERGSSLLPVGVCSVAGNFEQGDMVGVYDSQGREIARGLVNYGAEDLRRILGCHTNQIRERLGRHDFDEVIHRDNLVLL
jgi:glutamate 5-kinase